jgi:hypothetical protein
LTFAVYSYLSSPCSLLSLHQVLITYSIHAIMSETEVKPQFQSDFEEFDTPTQRTKAPVSRILDSVRLGLTLLALLSSIVIVGTSSHTLGTFQSTHLGDEFLLPLWPADFDLRPTTALVACSVFIIFFSALSLIASSVPAVRTFQLSLCTSQH